MKFMNKINNAMNKIKNAVYTVGALAVLDTIHTYVWIKKKFNPNYTVFKF